MISQKIILKELIDKDKKLKKLVEELKRNSLYKELAEKIITTTKLIPNNGKKTDPAHPAIYPTGIVPEYERLEPREIKLYDLIVRRFLATFADAATRETNKIIIDIESENFVAKGTRTVYQGWFEFYGPHVKLEEEELPVVNKGDHVANPKTKLQSKETKPPKRFTPASLIKELEKRNLGTKATRASIIETLFDREYVIKKTIFREIRIERMLLDFQCWRDKEENVLFPQRGNTYTNGILTFLKKSDIEYK